MSRVLFAGLILAGLSAPPVAAQEPPRPACGPAPEIIERLRSDYGLRAVATMRIRAELPATLYANTAGGWVIIAHPEPGVACVTGPGGDGFRLLPMPREDSI